MMTARYIRWIAVATLFSCLQVFSEDDSLVLDGKVFELKPFVIYESEVDVIDGFTGKKYTGYNEVVLDFVDTFNEILRKYHKKLLVFEIEHLNFRIQDGIEFENELAELALSFGITNFKVDQEQWLIKEKAILHRLNQDPFYKIEGLVVWELDKLAKIQPNLPKSKYAKDIRFNNETKQWERRVTTEWKVSYMQYNQNNRNARGKPVNILKKQGLNLDTNEGFHFINRALSNHVYPNAFKDVRLTYPVLISSKEPHEEQLRRLQETYVQNLYHIYDPFSWVARRNTRFRGGFSRDLTRHFENRRYPIKDRDWFDPVLSHFLSDVITTKRHGTKEIYSLYAYQRFMLSPNVLGEDLDLLNWHKGENREGKHQGKRAEIRLNWDNPSGARFVVLDAYMRYTDQFVNLLREKLTNSKKKRSGKQILEQTIEEVSGVPFDIYLNKAIKAQKEMIEKYRDEL